MSKRKANKYKEQQRLQLLNNSESISWWILLAVLLLIPLVLGLREFYFYSPNLVGSINDSQSIPEVFVFYKWYVLMILSLLAFAVFVGRITLLQQDIRSSYMNLPLAVLIGALLLSLLLAEYHQIALLGMHDMREGASTWLCYFLLFFIAAQTTLPAGRDKFIMAALAIIVGINALMGILLFYGINIMDNHLIANLVLLGHAGQFSSSGEIFGTMTNPNYLSPLGACVGIFFMVLCILSEKPLRVWLTGLAAVVSFSIIYTSLSTSGFISIIATAVIALPTAIYLSRQRLQSALRMAALLVAFIGLFFLYNAYNPSVMDETFGFMKGFAQSSAERIEQELDLPVAWADEIDVIPVEGERPESTARVLSDTISDPELLPVTPQPTFGSNRGYIWSESWALITASPKYMLVGYGLDTMAFYFPYGSQDHYAHRGNIDEIISKPHNFYLGVAYGMGIPALLAMLALFLLVLWKEKPRRGEGESTALTAALWSMAVCFMVQFLVNDSSIGISIIFWIMMGLLVSVGREHHA